MCIEKDSEIINRAREHLIAEVRRTGRRHTSVVALPNGHMGRSHIHLEAIPESDDAPDPRIAYLNNVRAPV